MSEAGDVVALVALTLAIAGLVLAVVAAWPDGRP